MLSLGSIPNSDKELFLLISDLAGYAENKAKIGMAALVKRSGESDPGLDGNKFPSPAYLLSRHFALLIFQPSQPLPRIDNIGEAGIGVFPEGEEFP